MKKSEKKDAAAPPKKRKEGSSIFDALVTSVAITAVGSVVIYALALGITTFTASRNAGHAFQPVRIAASIMERDIRSIRSDASIECASPQAFSFIAGGGVPVSYRFAGGTLRHNEQTLLQDLAGFRFVYRDAKGTAIDTPRVSPDRSDIRLVTVRLTAVSGDRPETAELTVCPRMLRE
ncbi:MAG TPA: hypothetical protein P5287_05340 [bacterium]|nr:hypothetical protein [bacterium]